MRLCQHAAQPGEVSAAAEIQVFHEKVSAAARDAVRIGLGRLHSRIAQRPQAFGFCGERVGQPGFIYLEKAPGATRGDPVTVVDAAAGDAHSRLDAELNPKLSPK